MNRSVLKNVMKASMALLLSISMTSGTVSAIAQEHPIADEPVRYEADYPNGCGALNDKNEFMGNVTYKISGDTLTISGEGPMADMQHIQPWAGQRDSIKKVVIGDGVTYIGAKAFFNFNNLDSVTMSSTVKGIGNIAFWQCTGLKEIHIDAEYVGEAAFKDCKNLRSVYIGSNVKAVGPSAFEGCKNIDGVYINDLANWCGICFGGFKSNPLEWDLEPADINGYRRLYLNGQEITDLSIPEGVKTIGNYAFYQAGHIKSVDIPASVDSIGEYAFCLNKSLEKVTGAKNVASIGIKAFEGDDRLKQAPFVSNPDKIEYIGLHAFLNSGLMDIVGTTYRAAHRQLVKIGSWKNQELEWIVLDIKDGKALVLSKDIIEFIPFCDYMSPYLGANTTWNMTWNGQDPENNKPLRNWLNDDFFDQAFSGSQKEKIFVTAIDGDDNPVFGTNGGGSSEDRVFILSAAELNDEKYFPNIEDRMAKRLPTAIPLAPYQNDPAIQHGNLNPDKQNAGDLLTSYYWVRTPGIFGYTQAFVNYTGEIICTGVDKKFMVAGARPAMWVDAEAFGIKDTEKGIKDFVTRLYELCLDREPDNKGFEEWVLGLKYGRFSAAAAAKGFFDSQEMNNKKLTDSEFLDLCYRVLMGREADDAGKKSWLNVLDKTRSGISRRFVLKQFIDSQEFQYICNEYGVNKDTIELKELRDKNYQISCYVARCYYLTLSRSYDVAGIEYWINEIISAENQREKAISTAKSFLHSEEFNNKNLDDTEFCKVLYRLFLDREADDAGLKDWVGKLEKGADRDKVIDGFAYSQEFGKILDKYKLK